MLREKFRERFGRSPDVIAEAPGRIEFIGNHTDYNGGLVLGAAIAQRVRVAVARRADGMWRFASDYTGDIHAVPAGQTQKHSGAESWLNYPLGVLYALRSFGSVLPGGFDFLAVADLPAGAGLSSSAAIELASALAFLALTGENVPKPRLVELTRFAENEFVGVPCGILDQGVSAFGRRDHLVLIDCAGPKFETIPLPPIARFWLFNTGIKHALVDGLYATRHRECMAAADALGVESLRQATPEMVAGAKLASELGRRARHVTEEIARVRATITALRAGDLQAVGQMLLASHDSSRRLFENSTAELDFLVEELARLPGVLGARLTGGGFGGAVMALTSPEFGAAETQRVSDAYRARFGHSLEVFTTQAGDGARIVETA